jgi:hypothetical protein
MQQTVAAGADWIKLVVAGGVNGPGERATMALYTEAEVAVAMTEARAPSTPVAVAAYGGPSVRFLCRAWREHDRALRALRQRCARCGGRASRDVGADALRRGFAVIGYMYLYTKTLILRPLQLSGLHASDVYEIVGDHAEPDQRVIPLSPLDRQRLRSCRRLATLMRPSHPGRHFLPLRKLGSSASPYFTEKCISPRTAQRWRVTGDGPPFVRLGPHNIVYGLSDAEGIVTLSNEERGAWDPAGHRAPHPRT